MNTNPKLTVIELRKSSYKAWPSGLNDTSSFCQRPESAENKIKQWIIDAEAQIWSLIVVPQVILSEVPEQPLTTLSVMALKV